MSNNTNPVLDGVWIEPIELTPTNYVCELNTIPPTIQSVVLLANVNGVTDFTVLPALSSVPQGHTITIVSGVADSEVRAMNAGELINSVDCGTDVAASAVLTTDNTKPTADDTVTIGTGVGHERVYRFKALADMEQAYDVCISTVDADTTLLNLAKAINGTGTAGVNYYKGTEPHLDVTSSVVSSHAITVTAKVKGDIGNAIAKAENSTHLDWDGVGAVFTNGANAGEYLLNDNYSVHKFTKISDTIGWMGKGWTALGASVTAVIPN